MVPQPGLGLSSCSAPGFTSSDRSLNLCPVRVLTVIRTSAGPGAGLSGCQPPGVINCVALINQALNSHTGSTQLPGTCSLSPLVLIVWH